MDAQHRLSIAVLCVQGAGQLPGEQAQLPAEAAEDHWVQNIADTGVLLSGGRLQASGAAFFCVQNIAGAYAPHMCLVMRDWLP